MILSPLARSTFDLSRCVWQFGSAPQRSWDPATPPGAAFDLDQVQEWLPATVPGDVHSDLLAHGRIADPYLGAGLAACRWVEGVDWWYRTRLSLALEHGQRAVLEFDGIDYLSAVYVDGHELARHEGMFARQVIELPPQLAERAEVELAVRIWGSDALPHYAQRLWERLWGRLAGAAQGAFQPFDDRLATLKTPMHFGWDFAPRLRTVGIWDDARLVVCNGVYVRDVHVRAEPLALPADPGPAAVRLRLDVDSNDGRSIVVRVHIRPLGDGGDAGWQFEFPVRLTAGRSEPRLTFELPAARLWQPWERGEPCLYQMHIALYAVGSPALLDTFSTRFGVRSLALQQTDQGHPWRAVVNGEPLFLRGVNWVPLDALAGRVEQERYATLLAEAQATGVNFVRVWGGGGRQRRAFYDLCDELGLLVWQEFPVACVFLDHLPRSAGLPGVAPPGGNRHRAGAAQPSQPLAVVRRQRVESPAATARPWLCWPPRSSDEDGARPFLPASPGPGDAHNWQVWHGLAPLSAYRREQASMVSEFGLQAAPAVISLRQFLPAEELWPPGAGWQRHNADLSKLARYARWFEDALEPDALARFVQASQRAQAAGLQVLIEHVRRRQGDDRRAGRLAVERAVAQRSAGA